MQKTVPLRKKNIPALTRAGFFMEFALTVDLQK